MPRRDDIATEEVATYVQLLAASQLAGHFDMSSAMFGGLVGGLAFLAVIYLGVAAGVTRMDFLHILGTMMLPGGRSLSVHAVGFVAHSMLAAMFGLVYAAIIHAIGGMSEPGTVAGYDLLIGAVHGLLIVGVLPPLLANMHPLVLSGEIEYPGVALAGYGRLTPLGSVMAHIAFGMVAGALYGSAVL